MKQQPPSMVEWTEQLNRNPPPAQPHPKPTTAAEAVAWLHSNTAASRLALGELEAAFSRLEEDTGFVLTAKVGANG
jgi:hypothetical protein